MENLAICGKPRLNLELLIKFMSKNASSDFDESQKPDNPQEMLKSNFYKDFNSSSTTTR